MGSVRLVAAAAFAAVVGCTGETAELPPPEPWSPPSEGAPECELSADCPAGTYCDLGECVQECNTVDPCTGELTCHPRGRCTEDPAGPADPEPSTTHTAAVHAADDVIYVGASDSAVVLRFEASPADASIRYRVDPRVAWLRVAEPRGTFTGALTVMLEIDRSGLGTGAHSGDVVLHTTAGDVTVPVHLDQGLSAVYQGQLEYAAPRPLGTVPVRLEVREDHGTAAVRIDPERSPSFPATGGRSATTTARFDDGVLTGSLTQVFAPEELGGERTLVHRPLGREIRFELTPSPGGGLVGSFVERWFGLFPAPVEVAGDVSLARVAGAEPGEFAPDLPPELPPHPSVNPPALTSQCRWAASTAAGTAGGGCTEDVSVSQLVACGDALLDRGASLRGATLVTEAADGVSGYDEMSDVCASELSAASSGPTGTAGAVQCLRPANLSCALSYFGLAAQRGDPEANGRIGEAVAAYADAGLLLLQDSLVEAYDTPYRTDAASVGSTMLSVLAEGRAWAHAPLQFAFDPFVLDALRSTGPAIASDADHRPLRRMAQLLARDRLAAEEEALIETRTRGTDSSTVRERIHRDSMRLLVALVALSEIERSQDAPPSAELGLFAEALTELGRRSIELSDAVDPLGIPHGFVEFLYDPLMAGPDRATNFQQVLRAHEREVVAALAAEEEASTAVRDFDARTDAITRTLEDIDREVDRRLVEICGADPAAPLEPNLADCGASTGELAQARSVYEQEVQGMRIALARIEGLDARVRIQRQRLEEVYRIRAETIAFVDSTNHEINELEIRQREIQAARDFLQIAASSNLFNAGAPAAMAAASMALGLYQAELAVRQMRLQQLQGLQIMRADMQVEYVNGMATIQEMLVGMAELNLELVLAGIRAATAAIRVATLEQRVDTFQSERELLLARELDGIANDPSFRILRDRAVEQAIVARERALRGIYLAARAFEFETNTRLPAIETDLVPALAASEIQDFVGCLESNFTRFRSAYGVPQTFVDEISLREDVLGIRGPVEDPVTGEVVTEAEQFRRLLLSPSNIGPDGTVGLSFVTTLSPGNGVFSTMTCNDQIRTLQVKVIGDALGDDQARIYLWQGGTSLMRGCDAYRGGRGDVLREYDIAPRRVEIQAGVNSYPTAPADAQLFGRSVAATEWRLAIPPGDVAPSNADLDLRSVDDIVLRIEHSAISLSDGPVDYTPVCGG